MNDCMIDGCLIDQLEDTTDEELVRILYPNTDIEGEEDDDSPDPWTEMKGQGADDALHHEWKINLEYKDIFLQSKETAYVSQKLESYHHDFAWHSSRGAD